MQCKITGLMAATLILAGCAANIWRASPHPLTALDQVKIYTQRPARYERLGTVTHLGLLDKNWQNADVAPVFDALRKEAGAMGANGLLLLDDTTMADGSVKSTYQGTPYVLAIHTQTNTVIAQAIFVVKE